MTRVTRSFKVNPDVWKDAWKKCIDLDMEISEYLEGLIKTDLAKSK